MGSKKPYLGVILVQIFLSGMTLVSKAAFASGMNIHVFVFYRQAAGTFFYLPLVMIFKRKESRPALSLMDFLKIFMIALIGMTIGFNAYGVGVDFTSANLGAAAFNCLPVTTFFFALILRMEKLNLRRASGIAKGVGLLVCIAGVAVLAFYKGPYLKPLINHQVLKYHKSQAHAASGKRWILGCFFLFITSISWGLWIVLQAQFLKKYPSPLIFSSHQTMLSSVQALVLAIAMERNPSEWKLGFNIRLFAVLYCGICVAVATTFLQSWVIKEKGPVFYSMFTPLNLVLTIVGSELLLGEGIHLGSVIGAILLVLSLYIVLWGKNKESSIVNKESDQPPVLEPEDFSEMRSLP